MAPPQPMARKEGNMRGLLRWARAGGGNRPTVPRGIRQASSAAGCGGSGRMPSPGAGLCVAFAPGASAPFAQPVELFLQPDLQPPLGRLVVHALAHGVREARLAQRHAAFGVVVVLV